METLGALSFRTTVGYGSRGLLIGRCLLGFFHPRQERSRAYRWGEDGLLGITDRQCRLCFALALWNGHDPILKERLFGLTNSEGNHGEDVKEQCRGTKAAPYYVLNVPGQGQVQVKLRLFMGTEPVDEPPGKDFDAIFAQRVTEQRASTRIKPHLPCQRNRIR